MTGQSSVCGGGVYSCGQRRATDLVVASDSQDQEDTAGHNSSVAPVAAEDTTTTTTTTAPDGGAAAVSQEKRPSVDLSALERKTIRGGITRFHCRYFLKPRTEHRQKQQQQQAQAHREATDDQRAADAPTPEQTSNSLGGRQPAKSRAQR